MSEVGFDFAYMFKYSERPDTRAARHMKDDVTEYIKTRRLNEIIALQNELSAASKKADIGKSFEVLVEGKARKNIAVTDNGNRISAVDVEQNNSVTMMGRTSGNKVVVFRSDSVRPGDYVNVTITRSTSATLIGNII